MMDNIKGAWMALVAICMIAFSFLYLSIWIITMAMFFIVFYLLYLSQHVHGQVTPRDPQNIPSRIPYIGHPLGLILEGGRYLRVLGQRYSHLPIFSLPAVTSRIYVVSSPALALEIQRKKTLLFDPLVPDLTQRVLGMDKTTVKQMRENVDRAEGNWGPVPDMHDAVAKGLGAGPVLDELITASLAELMGFLNGYGERISGRRPRVDLMKWTKHAYASSTARFLYGPDNPIARDQPLEKSFWDFDAGIGYLLLGIWPSITASKAYQGRERLVGAFEEYLWAGHQQTASKMVQMRMEVLDKNDLSLDAMARSELSFLFAGIVNTAISSFWQVLRIFADPELLLEIRKEIQDAHPNLAKSSDIILSLPTLKSKCALLSSCFRESLRLASDLSSTRLVTEDTTLTYKPPDGGIAEYVVRKGSIIQISGAAIHASTKIWGSDAFKFNPRRFLTKEAARVHPAAFRAFGGGSTLCPGRHLASAEVFAWTAAVVMGFDIVGVDGKPLDVPSKNDTRLPVHVCEPQREVQVCMKWKGRRVTVEK
jgi:cytochrome P450